MTPEQFRKRVQQLEPLGSSQSARHTWDRNRHEMRGHFSKGDLTNFLTWSTVVGTMFTGDRGFTQTELTALRGAPDAARWLRAIREPGIGNPPRMSADSGTSGNLVHSAYHLYRWEHATGQRVDALESIVEFGGGYGSLALLSRRLGFDGDYLLVDLPEMLLLQEYYLDKCGIAGVRYVTPEALTAEAPDLLVACWSLSETPLDVRRRFVERVTPGAWLLAYQPRWFDIDNAAWVEEYTAAQTAVWTHESACAGSRYAMGVRSG